MEEQAGAVPVAVAVVEERRAHGGLERKHAVAHPEGAPAGPDPPALLVETLVRERPPALVGDRQPEHVPDEVPHHVAARRPGGKHDLRGFPIQQRRHAHLDLEFVRRRLGHRDAVLDRLGRGNTGRHGGAG